MGGAGYSGKPLAAKLGIKPGHRLVLIGPPADFNTTLGPLPDGVAIGRGRAGQMDIVLLFCGNRARLSGGFAKAKRLMRPGGALWVCWPKRSSGMVTDLGENIVRAEALAGGLVDVKVCAVDQIWSGLKLVYRLKDRPSGTR